MTKVLVLYYSSWGHVETMAKSVAEGAKEVPGVEVTIKRVPELVPEDVRAAFHYKTDLTGEIATVDELPNYDAIIIGTPTRFGSMAAQMRNFLDQTGGLWAKGALIGKVGSIFVSTAVGGGNESTILSSIPTLLHHGMVVAGLPYSAPELSDISEFRGGSPYGAGSIAAGDGSRQPSTKELSMARQQGKHVAGIAAKLAK